MGHATMWSPYPRGREGYNKFARRRRNLLVLSALVVSVFLFIRWHLDGTELPLVLPHVGLPDIRNEAGLRVSTKSGGASTASAQEGVRLPPPKPSKSNRDPTLPSYCDAFPDDRIAVVVKTGATEALSKLPTQLVSSLRCVRDPLFFSDLDQTMGPYRIHDVLADFPGALMKNNPDFDLYRLQQRLVAEGREQEIPALAKLPIATNDWRTPGKSAAWGLDKYKFLHMVERSWKMQPGRDWYIYLEADTYLSFPNLYRWLAQHDPHKKLYFGEPVQMKEHETPLAFAYGGAGIVLSGAAVREFCVERSGIPQRFASRIWKWWFGDFVLADALDEELGLRVTNALPNFNPDSPDMIAFGEHNWCQPVVTMHHLGPKVVDAIYRAEKGKQFEEFLFRDVYNAAYSAGLPKDVRADWNAADYANYTLRVPPKNMKPQKSFSYVFKLWDPHEKLEACELACFQHQSCFQWTFTNVETMPADGSKVQRKTQCHLSGVFRLGEAKQPDVVHNATMTTQTSWTSGWSRGRVERFLLSHTNCGADRSTEIIPDSQFDFNVDDDPVEQETHEDATPEGESSADAPAEEQQNDDDVEVELVIEYVDE